MLECEEPVCEALLLPLEDWVPALFRTASLGTRTLGAALAYAPALWVTAGLAAVLYGWFPRASAAAWIVPAYAFVCGYLGELVGFPSWLNDLSPFGHVPQLPAATLDGAAWLSLLALTALAAALLALGLAGFGRRDLDTK